MPWLGKWQLVNSSVQSLRTIHLSGLETATLHVPTWREFEAFAILTIAVSIDALAAEIRAGAAAYANMIDQPSRTSQRAHVLHLLDQLKLERGCKLITRRVSSDDLRSHSMMLGAIVIHLDLVFRSSVAAGEVVFTADRGIVRVAEHPQLKGFPIGVVLVQPTRRLVRRRRELFAEDGGVLGETDVVMPYALAASPPRLGAGAGLLRAVLADVAELDSGSGRSTRVVTYSPLTGMRARVIRLVDDGAAWTANMARRPETDGDLLKRQLLDLLASRHLPESITEPARSWLMAESREFAESADYAVGNFHRGMGAHLVGLTDGGDPYDSDSMWARAYFDYGVPSDAE